MKMKMAQILSASLLSLLLGSCSVQHEPVEVYLPSEWHTPASDGIEQGALDNFLWWEALEDPILSSLIERADAQNLDLYIASTSIMEALPAGKAQVELAEENLCDIWVTLSAEVGKNYIELRGSQKRLEVLMRNLEAQKETIHLVKELIKIGKSNTIDLQQAEVQLNSIAAQKPLIELAIEKAIHRLSILLGQAPGELFCELLIPGILPKLPCQKPIDSPCELVRRRPDIRKAERELALSRQDKIKFQRAYYEYQKSVLDALEETENAMASLRYEMERNKVLASTKEADQVAYKLIFELYQNGFKDYLEVQVMNRSLLEAEDDYIQSEVQLLLHYISLYKALGGGWEEVSEEC